jgi:CheY-like chemotaxis protein
MEQVGPALVVDPSAVAREYLQRILRLRCARADAVADCAAARRLIDERGDYVLVIADCASPGGGGLSLLDPVALGGSARPALVLLASRTNHDEEVRALMRGASGYFAKPITVGTLRAVLKHVQSGKWPSADRRAHSTPAARAILVDRADGSRSLSFDVHDLSCSGALVATHAPLPIGTRLSLCIALQEGEIQVEAEVVRVQDPVWGTPSGVAVAFRGMNASTRALVELHVSRSGARR